MTNISQELLHIGFFNLVQVFWIICCFMWKRTRSLLLILPLISSLFSLLFRYQKLSSLFSQGLSVTQSWNSVHTWTVGWCIMYLNRAGVNLFLHLFSHQFHNINFLLHFCESYKVKLDTHMGKGLICCVHQIQAARIYLLFFFFFSVSPINKHYGNVSVFVR